MTTTASGLRIEPVDPFDDDGVAAWHAVYAEAQVAGNEDHATPWQLGEMRVLLQDAGSRVADRAWSGFAGDRLVAAGFLRMPLQDNLDRCEVAVQVLPDARRRGHGRMLAARLEEEARALGRSVLYAEISWDVAGGSHGTGRAGAEFARALDFSLALGDVQRELELPVPDGTLAALVDQVAPYHAGYTLRSFVGPVPDDLVEGWVGLLGSLSTEAPTGELQLEPETITVRQHRDAEEVMWRQGRTKYNTVALAPTGDVVAYTDIATTVHEPGRGYQWGTLVRRDHRGHRLGLAVKIANLGLLQAERPDITRLVTWNAEENAHMVAVNEQLGFRPVARLGEFQKVVGGRR
jgi:GNAT superfamily N-acetyltransferase